MLIISRRRGEAIIINKDIKIYYLGQNDFNQARFGIEAPPAVSVHREEIHKRIELEEQNKTA